MGNLKSVLLAVMIGLPITFTWLDAALAQATPQRGGTMIFTLATDPPTLNPSVSSSFPTQLVGCIILQGLTRVDSAGDIKPLLAKSWTISPDGKTYTFELNKANWQDGKPFTSEDVRYSLLEVSSKYSSTFRGAARKIDGVDTPAPDRAVIRLKEPYGPLLLSLACSQGGAIVPAHVFQGTDALKNPASTTAPVGLGPFLLSEWKRGDHLRLTRNPDYWEAGKPYLDGLVAKIIPQAASRAQALQAGEVDYVTYFYLPSTDYAQIRANPKLDLKPARVAPGTNFMFINVQRKPLDDKLVRQALFMAIDRTYLLRNVFLGLGAEGVMPFTSQIKWAANPEIDYRKMYPFDVAKANAMLDEAGLKRGADGVRLKLELMYFAESQELARAAAAVKAMWREVGVELTIAGLDRAIAIKRMYKERDVDVSLVTMTSYGDPAIGIARNFVTAGIGKSFSNAAGYSNPEVDALFVKGEQSTNIGDRATHYHKVQAILAVDLPVLTLHERDKFDGMSRSIEGIDDENFTITWRDAWRKQ